MFSCSFIKLSRSGRRCVRLLPWPAFLVLLACNGNYQAPIAERSENLDRSGPVIVESSDDSPSRYGGGAIVTASAPGNVTRAASVPATHRIVAGDTLYSISFQYDLDARRLADANGLTPPYPLVPGATLVLDVNRVTPGRPAAVEPTQGLPGRAVANNDIAQALPAAVPGGGVTRQPIVATPIESRTPPTNPAVSEPSSVATTAITPSLPSLPAEPSWRWPIDGAVLSRFQSESSSRKGIDIGGREGESVYAAATGDVVYAGNGIQGSGNLVILRHNDRLLSAYAQNRSLLVREGQRVQAGEPIAEVGSNADGVPLLHFEIRLDGKPVDPVGYLPRN